MNLEPVRRVLDALGVRYALIGGHALAARGYPRFTVDIDLLKLAAGGFADLQDVAALLATGERSGLIADVESRIAAVRPDVRDTWRRLIERTER